MPALRMPLMAAALAAGLLWSQPAQAQQWLAFNVGEFSLRGLDGRIHDDVLLENSTVFDIYPSDFSNVTFGGEWQAGIGRRLEIGVGLDYYRRTVPSVYLDYVDFDGSEIYQDFRLRTTPVTFTLRVHPFGTDAPFQPYVGGGVGVFNWRYSEVGDFIDFTTFEVFNDRFVATGTDVGAVVLGGVRVPIGTWFAAGFEARYQHAAGTVGVDQGFLAERIDLGGFSTRYSIQFRF